MRWDESTEFDFESSGVNRACATFVSTTAPACAQVWHQFVLFLDQAVDGGNHFVTLGLRTAPQYSDVFFDARMQHFDAEQSFPFPFSHASSASDLGPRHAAALIALASGRRHLEPLETLCPDADEPR